MTSSTAAQSTLGLRSISAAQRDRGEVVGAHVRERAAVAADRRADRVADKGFFRHGAFRFVGSRRAPVRRRDGRCEAAIASGTPVRRASSSKRQAVDHLDDAQAVAASRRSRRGRCRRGRRSRCRSADTCSCATILLSPLLVRCSIITNTCFAPIARSIAPPTAGIASGAPVCQLARSPSTETWNAPSTQKSRWPPRIIANESAWWKYAPPGSSVTGCLPALMRSESSCPGAGAGPMPSRPFSLCRMISRSFGRWLATSVGRPMPRFT